MFTRHIRFFVALVFTASSVLLSQAIPAQATVPSPFDTSFGTNGLAIIDLPLQRSESVATDIISDPSGSLFVLLHVPRGNEDPGFVSVAKLSSNGVAVSAFGTNGRSQELNLLGPNFALQADGKIIVSGFQFSNNQKKIVVYRLTSTGQVDTTFGVDGAYILPAFPGKNIPGSELLLALNQSNERIHLGFNIKQQQGPNNNFYFITLTSDGQLDYDWSSGGAEEVVPPHEQSASAYSTLTSIQLLSDGSVLGIGEVSTINNVREIALIKLNEFGYLDPTYDGASNGNGMVLIPFASESDARMAAGTVLQDDSIVLAGLAGTSNVGPWHYGVAKVSFDGTVDTTFGQDGFALSNLETNADNLPTRIGVQTDGRFVFTINSGTTGGFMRVETDGTFSNSPHCSQCLWSGANDNTAATSLIVQTDGKIVVTGEHRTEKNSVVRRFTSAGVADGTFTNSNIQVDAEKWEFSIFKVHPQPDGSIIGIGSASPGFMSANSRGVVYKFTSSGALDLQFGLGGYLFMSPPIMGLEVSLNDFNVLANGKILVSANGESDQTNDTSIILWRLNSNGTLDSSFGTSGFIITSGNGTRLYPVALIVNSDGKITVPLARYANGNYEPWIYRYTETGTLDPSFTDSQNLAGRVKPSIGDGTGYLNYAAPAENGKILVAGFTTINGQTHTYLARFLPDGTLDSSFSNGYVSWESELPYSMNYVTKTYQDDTGRIYVFGATRSPLMTGLLIQLNSDGSRNGAFNTTGYATIAYRNPAQIDYSESSDAVVNNGIFTVIGGGDSDPRQYRSSNFSGVARISLSGAVDANFGINGILDPFPSQETYFTDIAPLSNGMNLIAGGLEQGSEYKILLMKIGPTSSPASSTTTSTTTTIPPTTTSPPTTTAPSTTSTTTPATSTAETKSSSEIKLVVSVKQASILNQLKITVPKGGKVAMTSKTAKVCRVSKARVFAISPGTCRITVTVTNNKKKTSKVLTLKIS
jgi:uncharacterized delta-60 repeat protein